ncbi:MAG TPA: ADP-glyceromanno-heptose 6-epimerase [Niastella sp.]|nr:ADP-glyceromanno-heptose 6-epimerase [Niastella sp.]
MNKDSIIVVTGAAGFIGSCLTGFLNTKGYNRLILVDDFSKVEKTANLDGKQFEEKVEREAFFAWLAKNKPQIGFVFHIGARTDTTEFDYSIHEHLNVEYSQKIWNYCTENNVPVVYASSAATYGSGEEGYNDDHAIVYSLKPLNPYGVSKNEFDKWALQQATQPPFWAGLKFFNVYGPNEYHKGRMASVIWHSFNQINNQGFVKLFKSHKEGFKDGQQLRDFVYVKDLLKVCYWLMEQFDASTSAQQHVASGLYNLGTGKARSFEDLAKATFSGLDKEAKIEFIPMPEDIRDKYQYFTEANMQKLKDAGYSDSFYSLEEGVNDYVRNYLAKGTYY